MGATKAKNLNTKRAGKRNLPRSWICLAGAAAAAALGCEATLGTGTEPGGVVETPGEGPDGGVDTPPTTPQVGGIPLDPDACDAGLNVTFGGLRRVTKPQYNRMVRDLLGDSRDLSQDFGFDSVLGNFAVNLDVVSEIQVEQYFQAAEVAAEEAAANPSRWLTCDPTVDEEGCAQSTIRALGRRAYRRPLTDVESAGLFGIYSAARAETDFSNGMKSCSRVC